MHVPHHTRLWLLAATLLLGSSPAGADTRPSTPATPAEVYDIVIKGGRVIDPESGLDATGYNVAIDGARIVRVTGDELAGTVEVDATGLVVAPGFIDLHAHGQGIFANRMQAFDGVTTALEMESGVLPIDEFYARAAREGRVLNYGASAGWTYARIQAINGPQLGPPDGTLEYFQRAFAFTDWKGPATPEQVEVILELIAEGLRQGGLGIGFNSGYAPGFGNDEGLQVHQLAADHGVSTWVHMRYTHQDDEPGNSRESVEELIEFAEKTGSQIHIHHINSSLKRAVGPVGDLIREAQKSGLDISTETYPYGAGSTAIGSFDIPRILRQGYDYWLFEYNGETLTQQRFDEVYRATKGGAPVVVHWLNTERRGWRYADGVHGPPDELTDELVASDRAALAAAVLFPGGAIGSDGMPWTYVCDDGASGRPCNALLTPEDDRAWPLRLPDGVRAFAHPRSAGTFTRLLKDYVTWSGPVEPGKMPPSEAIARASLYPAQILQKSVAQMLFKGRLQVGMDADVIVFDPARLEERATFNEPAQASVGMQHVLVNGQFVIRDARMTMALPGQPIRRQPRTVIHNVRLFDGVSGQLRDGLSVAIAGDRIVEVAAKPRSTGGVTLIDGGGHVLMPGLIDMHHHAFMAGSTDLATLTADPGFLHIVAAATAGETLMRGFTTVRDLGGPVFGLKRAIDAGVVPGPRIYPSGPIISQSSGHGDFRQRWETAREFGGRSSHSEVLGVTRIADGHDQVLIAAREALRLGASQLKLAAGGGASSAYDPIDVNEYTTAEFKAAVAAAENWGTYVTVHIYNPEGVRRAVEAGVKCIDHGQLIDQPTMKWLAEHDVWLSMQPFADGPGQAEKRKLVNVGTDQAYRWAQQYGVKLVFGTDRMRAQATLMNQDLVTMGKWFTGAEALKQATGNAGELLQLSGERNPYPHPLGVVAPGAYADLLLVEGNPIADLAPLGDPEQNLLLIMKGGKIYKDRRTASVQE